MIKPSRVPGHPIVGEEVPLRARMVAEPVRPATARVLRPSGLYDTVTLSAADDGLHVEGAYYVQEVGVHAWEVTATSPESKGRGDAFRTRAQITGEPAPTPTTTDATPLTQAQMDAELAKFSAL